MAGTVQYLWKVRFYSGEKDIVGPSLAPVKTPVNFANGTYRDLNGAGYQNVFQAGTTLLISTALAGTQVLGSSSTNSSGPDDATHTALRPKVDPYDCWVFTNSAGDVISSPKCADVENYCLYQPKPMQSRVEVVDISATDFQVLRPCKHLYAVGAGDVIVTYLNGAQDTLTVQANSLREVGEIATVVRTGTTATGLLLW